MEKRVAAADQRAAALQASLALALLVSVLRPAAPSPVSYHS